MRTIVVVVTRQIGDVLLTTPLIREARRLWPGAAIDVLGFTGTLGMLEGNPDVRCCIEIPAEDGFLGKLRLVAGLWQRYDLALIADPGDRAHTLGSIAAKKRSGVVPANTRSAWAKKRSMHHIVVSKGDMGDVHVVAERLHLLDPWQAPGHVPSQSLVPPAGLPLPDALAPRLQPGYVVMHTPSMWPYKQWPIEHFRELAARLAQAGKQIVLTGGPGEGDRACVAAMQGAGPDDQLIDAGVLNFRQLSTLLQGAALYIGPDTSVSHLAAACGTKVLAIFGPTNPQRWAPWPSGSEQPVRFQRHSPQQSMGNVTLVQARLPCVPCGKAGCEDHRQSRTDCLPAILPEVVAQRALDLLSLRT